MIPRDLRRDQMRRFVEGVDRGQRTLFPECLEDWIDEGNPVRAIDAFVEKLDLLGLGFDGVAPEATGRPSYHPSGLLKLYIYGYLNRVQSSRRLEREAGRNVEVMWLTCRLIPDHRRLPTSARIVGRRSSRSACNLSNCAARWACSRQRALRSMGVSSKPSTPATRTSRAGKWNGAAHSWRRAWRVISRNSTRPTCRSRPKSWQRRRPI